ncbi:uncharacterized protein PFB0145c-like isoform X2 [Octopus sinensis]|uniref:Uncharacterized protein PFB0145c-like isoform X2 n=1 Tax=Octopus sinensis TaxID=2607531 RepID=A0A7E6F831_9MOLL|nr:uncharacterized protein PFB0145c-like isoform X2 [Octopus sinensis]
MDPSKKDTLIQWLKEINSSFLIESLHNMKEGEQSTVLLNKLKATSYDLNTKKECFEIIKKFIEDKYDQSHVEQVNFDKDDEVDLAKIAILMLRVGLEGEHQEDFIKAALSLNEQSQLEIMSILKGILNGASADLPLDKLLINKSLEAFDSEDSSENSSQENSSENSSQEDATEQSPLACGSEELLHDASSNSNSGSANISPSQRKISLTSINMANEEIEQKNMLLRKLNCNLKLERHLRSEMEYDLEEKNKTILLKDDKIQELSSQIKELKKLQNQSDDYNNLKDQYDKLIAVADKMKSQSDELKSLKLENSSLIIENAKVYEELNEMKKMKMQLEAAQLNRDKYLEELQSEERKCFGLQLNLDYKQKILDETTHSKKILEENLVKMTEKYETLKINYEEETFAFWSEKQPTGESMNVITDLILTELKAELENIKATWIAPDIYKQLKMDLSKVTSERDVFKSQWLNLQEEFISLKLNKDLFQNEVEKENSEHDNVQHQLLDKQLTIEILKEDLESICVRDSNWQQIEEICKSEQHHQTKVTPVKSSIQNFAQKIIHATKTNISTEDTEFEKVKLLLEENAAIKKELAKQFKELTGEKQDVFEKLELETADSKELVTVLKPKLETVNQNTIEQKCKLKGGFQELTEVHNLSLEERYLETLKEVEQIGVQLSEKDNRICELTKSLSEKSSLVEEYLNSNNELTQIITSLKENVSEKETETNLLKKELEEKSGTISEKDAKLDELTSLVGEMQQKISEISQKHFSEIMTMEEKLKNFKDIQAKLGQKEEELANQQAEYYSVAAASNKVYGQYEASVKTYQDLVSKLCNKVENQDKQIVCLLEQMSDMKLKAEQEYNKMKRELTEDNEEVKVSEQELIKIQSAFEETIVKSKSLEEHQKMLEEKQPTGYSISVVTDNLMTELKRELDNIKTTWIAPDIHEQLKADFSKLTCEQDILESKWLMLHNDFLSLKSNNDLLKNEMEKLKVEYNNAQHQILDKQQTIEIMKKDLERSPVKSSIQNFAEKIVHATKTKISTENTEFERVKWQLEENAAIKKKLEKQFKELTGEKQDVLEKLELETADSKELVTAVLKPKLETVNQNTIEQKSKLKGDFEELTKVHTLLLEERYLEALKEVEQISVQFGEKDNRICELTKSLSEKSSLVEEYLNSNNELTQIVTSLKEKVSEKKTETNLLKKELEEKSGTISEKDAKLDELTSLVGEMQQKVSEISQKHVSEIGKLQENLKVEYEEKISSITSEYVNKITNNYVCKSLMEIREKEHSNELETSKEMLHQEYNQKSCCLIEEYEKKLRSVSEDFEKKLSSDYVAVGKINEQNKKHIQEVIQMKEKLEEYEGKIKSQDEEHKEALQKVNIESQENISKNYISKEVFEAKLKDETKEYTQLKRKYVEEEEKLQRVLKEHEEKLAQVTLNYEEKIATDFVPRQTFECEQEKHVTALLKQETFYKEKLELLDEEHKIFINNKTIEFENNIATNYVLRSDFDDVQARLSEKEKEFSKLQAGYDLDVTASDSVKEQYETSVKTYKKEITEMCNKVESQNRQIECLQEQIAGMTEKAEQEYNEMKGELSRDLSNKDEEMKTSRQEMIKIQSAYEDEITKCKSLMEQINRLKGNHNNVITSLKESFQSEIKHMKETFEKEFYRREAIYNTDLKKLNDSHFQELTLSQTKWEKLHQTQCANISNYEKILSEKELQAADIKQQLLSEKEARAELEKCLASSKENHEEEIKKLNSIINEAREEYQQLKKKNSGTEAYFHNREQQITTDHTKTLSKVEEMNTSLASCLQISQKELEIFKKKHENISAEIDHLKKQLKTTKQERLTIIGKLQDYRVFYVLFTVMLCSFLVVPIYS